MKIVSTGRTLASEDFYKKKLELRKKKIIIFGISVLVLLIGLIFILRLESLQIKNIEVVGAQVIGSDAVQASARTVLAENYLWIIPKSNVFVYPDGSLKKFLFKTFPRFSSIDLTLTSTKSLNISVVEREPYALLCHLETGFPNGCYFLDETGFVFDKAPFFSRGVYFTYLILDEPEKLLATVILPEFSELSQFINQFESESIELREDFKLRLKSGPIIIWKREANLSKIYANLDSFLKSPSIDAAKLKEIDLRTNNKIFYK